MTRASLLTAVQRLEDAFQRASVERSYGGAIAYNFFGPPRITQDVDVLVLVPDTRMPAVIDALTASGFRASAPAGGPLQLTRMLSDLRSSAHLTVFQLEGVRIEMFAPWHPFHHEVLRRSPERDLGVCRIRIHAAEDLIVFKKIFDRPKDLQDIRAMLLTNRGLLDLERVRRDARGLLEDASYDELDELLRQYG